MVTDDDAYYFASRVFMLREADGYFYLTQSRALLDGVASWSQTPPLGILGAAVQAVTHLPLEGVAFWLPVALGVLSGLLAWGWGRLFDLSRPCTLAAALLGALIPSVVDRGGPGWYDTDPGIYLLFHGALLATAWVARAKGRPDPVQTGWLLACLGLLAWWWRPGIVALPMCLFLWGVTFPLARERFWRRLRLGAGVAVAAGCALAALLPDALLPHAVAATRAYLLIHADLALSGSRAMVFNSISELEPLGAAGVLAGLGGGLVPGAVALFAVGLMLWRKPRGAVFLIPSLLCAGLAFYAERFLFLAGLPVALGVAMLPETLPPLCPRIFQSRLGRMRVGSGVAWALALLVLAGCVRSLSALPPHNIFQRPEDRLVQALHRTAPADARLWNWWDDGYFLAARSGRVPLFDGGSQTPRMCFIAAHPLVSSDPLFARRWIRFFALRGEAGFAPLAAAWGGEAAAWRRLETVFSAPDARAALDASPSGVTADWLFPRGRVFLYLPQRFLKLSNWWFSMGKSPVPAPGTPRLRIDVFERKGFAYAPGDAQVSLPEAAEKKGYREFGGVFDTARTPLGPPWGDGRPGPYIVVSGGSPWLYIVDEEAIRSVGFRLLAPGGAELPGFSPVLTDDAHGGVWEVLP